MGKINNLKITAVMGSPLAGEAPYLDALMTFIIAFKSNKFESRKWNKATPLSEFQRLPIPLTEYDINGMKVNSCSDPILSYNIAEWHDYLTRRFETDKLSIIIDPSQRKNITIGGGYLKSIRKPIHLKNIDKIVWFARGNIGRCRITLKHINSIGYYRKIGYGIVSKWIVEEINSNNFIFSTMGNKKILMKTVPAGDDLKNIDGYRMGFGACLPPYWHGQNQREVAIPC